MGNSKLDLTSVTLMTTAFAWSDRTMGPVKHAIRKSCQAADFHSILIVTDTPQSEWEDIEEYVEGMERDTTIYIVPPIIDYSIRVRDADSQFQASRNQFSIEDLPRIVTGSTIADFTLNVHWDGFIVNPDAWNKDFLKYDYVGAAWPDGVVGNDAFCLRSMVMWDTLRSCPTPRNSFHEYIPPADVYICRNTYGGRTMMRHWFESRGIKFAPSEVADMFATEEKEWTGQFGFHGRRCLHDITRRGLYL